MRRPPVESLFLLNRPPSLELNLDLVSERTDRSPVKRCILVTVLLLVLAAPVTARAEKELGVQLPTWVERTSDNHYRNTYPLLRSVRHFRNLYGNSRGRVWVPIRGNPNVQGWHIINHRPRREWDAINIYEHDEKVYIYIVPSKTEPGKKR